MGRIRDGFNAVKRYFFSAGQVFSGNGNAATGIGVTSSLAKFLIEKSDFSRLREEEIYEQMYIWEPEISAAIIKISDMCRSSYEYFMVLDGGQVEEVEDIEIYNADDDNTLITPSQGQASIVKEMTDTANLIAPRIGVKDSFETWASIMYIHGYIVLERNPDLSLSVLPNNRISFVDNLTMIGSGPTELNYLMTTANYCIVDEHQTTQRIISKENYIVIKINNTPVHVKDRFNRNTYGIYPVSPLQRAVIPIWMKRQIQIIDILWRWANVPREHHKIEADAFNFALYPGTPDQQREAAEADLSRFIDSYAAQISNQVPDQAYVTSSNVTIDNIEHASSSYMASNELLTQLQDSLWFSLNVPRSFVSGSSDSSYASELVMSSVTSLRIKQISEKISDVVLDNMRERLLKINKQFPVERLQIKLSFDISESKLEKYKRMQIMGSLGCFTPTEVREEGEFPALTDKQITDEGLLVVNGIPTMYEQSDLDKIMKQKTNPPKPTTAQGIAKKVNNGGIRGGSSLKTPSSPATPKSQMKQPTDSAQSVLNKTAKKK